MSNRKVTFVGVPLDLGAGRRGVDMGPSAIRSAGIHQRVRELGYDVEDAGDIEVQIQETQDPGDPRLKFLKEIRATCEALRDKVMGILQKGRMPVVLGGDHSIAMGTISGVSRFHREKGEKVGLVWFDAHGDMNTPETSPTGNIHGMPLAAALGLGEKSLAGLAGATPMVDGARAAVIGLRDVDPAERENLRDSGIGAFTMRDIDERGMRTVMEEAIKRATSGTEGIHVSFDLDGMDPDFAPGVGTPSPGGISFREAHLAMEMLADTERVISAELVEVNPILDQSNRTANLGVGLLQSLLGKKIL
ncbi:MAG: arginase [Gemmatimonadetes bacterium]|nr:MAG: arginase [Gemmatimonadota bacterium]